MLNINKFIISNPDYDPEDLSSDEPKTLLDWRWMKKFMKSCCDVRKSTEGERERLYATLPRMYKLVAAKGIGDNEQHFVSIAEKFCKVVAKPMPELKGWLTEKEIEEYLTNSS